ncbi:TetR/AcrR family transcriptional regulator [Nonomuraea sp. M3C6]|uniref:TetR/AcrR family transcriptional regulator n=1 Tax=Nonomuraea marmarensis TaxID=3351344 RepID=A0ABW7APQ3_9ACTN
MVRTKAAGRRDGGGTRTEILRVALRLFTEKGYEATSTRDISEALGLTKSSLYYHFRSKEEILGSLVAERRHDLDELVEWITAQPRTPDLPLQAVLRWVEGTTPERLQVMRLAQVNQPIMRRLAASDQDPRAAFETVIDLLVDDDASTQDRLLLRMAFDTASAALLASRGTGVSPDDVIETARRASLALAHAFTQANTSRSQPTSGAPSHCSAGLNQVNAATEEEQGIKRAASSVRGHVKVPTGGQFEVTTGGRFRSPLLLRVVRVS